MNNYGYRSITTVVPGVAGRIERGSVARRQRKGDKFVTQERVTVMQNRVNGVTTSVTVLDRSGRAIARLSADAIY